MLLSRAQLETLRATMAAYTLYRVFWSAMGLQLSRLLGSSPLWIRMVFDCFHKGGILPLMRQVSRMSDRMVGRSRFHAEYWMRSGPGAEFAFILLVVLETSSASMGASMTSVGVGLGHSWVGGGPSGVLSPVSACLAVKYAVTAVMGTRHLIRGGDFLILAIQSLGLTRYSFWRATFLPIVRFRVGAWFGLRGLLLALLSCCLLAHAD